MGTLAAIIQAKVRSRCYMYQRMKFSEMCERIVPDIVYSNLNRL